MRSLLLAAALALTPLAAPAQVVGDPEVISLLMRKFGLEVQAGTDSEGAPKLESRIDGTDFQVYFYTCERLPCGSIQFSTGFNLDAPMDPAKVNDWNRRKRFAKVYLDDEGDPYIDMDVNLWGKGIGDDTFDDTLDIWRMLLSDFRKEIDW